MEAKLLAARRAVEEVADGMLLGLGTGTTAALFIEELAHRVRSEGLRLSCVPTSVATRQLALGVGLRVEERTPSLLDLTVDGADEIDPQLNLVKGRGGALLREKIVASSSRRMLVIGDESKLVDRLGRGRLPVEVLPFMHEATADRLRRLGLDPALRESETGPYITDNGNWIMDCRLAADAPRAEELAPALARTAGVLEHGLFMGMAARAFIGRLDGGVTDLSSAAAH